MKRTLCVLLVLLLLFSTLPFTALAAQNGTERTPILLGYVDLDYLADEILREIPTAGKSDREKIKAVYDWIILNCSRSSWDGQYHIDEEAFVNGKADTYYAQVEADLEAGKIRLREELEAYAGIQGDMFFLSYDSRDYIASFAYEMMLYRAGNCAHYSALLALLLSHLGYDCRLIDGVFLNRDGSAVEHKWNYVLLDGKYYWLDVRMDHSIYTSTGSINHTYFMIESTDEWAKRHQWDRTYSNWLAANAGSIMSDIYQIETASPAAPSSPPANPWENCSDWARPTMEAAWHAGLIPRSLSGADLKQGITRQEFAAVAMQLYENLTGTPAPQVPSPFSDTSDPAVASAYALGVVNGVGGDRYAPKATLTREQAVTMLGRVCELVSTGSVSDGGILAAGMSNVPDSFTDGSEIAAYARNYVAYFAGTGVVNGMGGNRFAPQGTMTREQAIKVALETIKLE